MSDKCWRRWDIDPLGVRQCAQHIEGWLGGQCVVNLPRARPAQDQRFGRCIDYRHLVGALKRKPCAFARWVLRDAAFPHAVYRQTWQLLAAQKIEREGCWAMVGLLVLAADGHEAQLAQELEQLIKLNQLPDLGAFYCADATERSGQISIHRRRVCVCLSDVACKDDWLLPAACKYRHKHHG